MSFKKKISDLIHQALLRLVWYAVKGLTSTYRYQYENVQHFNAVKPSGSFVFAVWHGEVIGVLSAHANTEPYLTLASRSKDGDFAAYVSAKMGFTPVRGSSRKKNADKGGKEAMEEYITKLSQGISGGITIDGPKGPRHVCKIGIVKIAQESGRPILPVINIPSKFWTINSWDKFQIPKPFSKITIRYAEPVLVFKDATPEQLDSYCRLVEKRLTDLEGDNVRTKAETRTR